MIARLVEKEAELGSHSRRHGRVQQLLTPRPEKEAAGKPLPLDSMERLCSNRLDPEGFITETHDDNMRCCCHYGLYMISNLISGTLVVLFWKNIGRHSVSGSHSNSIGRNELMYLTVGTWEKFLGMLRRFVQLHTHLLHRPELYYVI
jgi:hypothetical protein